jgi:hypothetical protein
MAQEAITPAVVTVTAAAEAATTQVLKTLASTVKAENPNIQGPRA